MWNFRAYFIQYIIYIRLMSSKGYPNLHTGQVLISEPFIEDPTFERSVILLVEYHAEGAVGFVLNQPSNFVLSDLVPDLSAVNLPIFMGGPVELDSLHCIHNCPHIDGAIGVKQNIYWGGDFEQIIAGFKSGLLKEHQFKFFMGYSGWAQNQLLNEIKQKSWIIGSIADRIIFDHTKNTKELWKYALKNKGGKVALLANSPISPLLN